ncbi:LysM peptidoglycan-binding domain-containing protein [Nonomuraea sp. NBC_00507]|uniref:BTAD domain-containing putative transcriptional regulator n=1 Tax=Nonomuraea sp. NBC_00507 TaxID=2976002 RepID=UPI002E193322
MIVGLPLLLYSMAGSPIPDRLPEPDQLLDTLARRDDGSLLIGALKYLAWGAWVSLMLSTFAEVIARIRGFSPVRSRLGMRRLAAYLITAATATLSTSPAMAAPTAPSTVVATAPHHPPTPDVYTVRPGDTLREIADKELGSAYRWSQIWKLNAHHRQVDGRVFSDPDLIRPGWKLRLPLAKKPEQPRRTVTPTPSDRPQPRTERTPPASAPAIGDDSQAGTMIRLPSGSLVTLAYLAGIGTALAASRLRRRRTRRRPAPTTEPAAQPRPEPTGGESRQAYAKHNQPVPNDRGFLSQQNVGLEAAPHHLILGYTPEGTPVRAPLSSLSLGLTGHGIHDVAGYLVNDLLRQASTSRTEVVMCTGVAESLYGPQSALANESLPGLILTETPAAAFRKFQEKLFTHRRTMLEREVDAPAAIPERDPGEALPSVVLVTEPDNELYTSVGALLVSNPRARCGVIVLGEWPPGTTCRLGPGFKVISAEGPLAEDLTGVELCHLTSAEAVEHLGQLAEPRSTPAGEGLPVAQKVWKGPELIRLSILGPPLVQVRDRAQPLELSWLQLNVLAYLALHPEGATNAQLTTALWPDEVGKDLHNALRHLRETLVSATRYENACAKTAPFISASTTKRTAVYRIDMRLISVDLRDYQAALNELKAARDDESRLAILTRAAELCRGELLSGVDAEWVDEHRYALTRSQADTLTRLAALCEHDDPERALDALERIRVLEPGVEENYLKIVRIQLRLGRDGDARRTVELLRQSLHELGLRSSPATERETARLLDVTPTGTTPEGGPVRRRRR